MSSPGGSWGPGGPYEPYGRRADDATPQYQGFGAFQQPPYPQQPQPPYPQQDHGFPQEFPEPPKKSRGPLIAGIAVAVVAVAAIVTTVVVLSTGDEAQPAPPAPTRTVTTPSPMIANPDLTPVVAGWQVVRVPARKAVYDVPPGWQLDPNPENVHGYGPPEDPVTATGVAEYQPGFCRSDPSSWRAITGASARRGPDNVSVANETLQKFIANAYTRGGTAPLVAAKPVENIQLSGGRPAVRASALVTLPKPGPCDSATVQVSVLATNNDKQSSVVFLAAADQNIPGAITPDTLNAIGQSLRPATP